MQHRTGHNRNRSSHAANMASRVHLIRQAMAQQCYGCVQSRRDPWEHSPDCEVWKTKEGCCSGT